MNSYLPMEEEQETAGLGAFFSQIPSILWQRRWFIIIPSVIGVIAAVAVAFLLPKKYESAAILLVQASSLPQDVVGQQTSTATEQRIEAIRQQIINRPALIGLIEANDLYPSERRSKPLSELVETMRKSITLVPQSLDVGSTGKDTTISVRLSFEYENPRKAQAVAQQLMEKLVEVDSTTNTTQLTETVQFLTDQQTDLQRQISDAEGQLSAFNEKYGGVLSSASTAMIGGGGQSYDMQIAMLERENASLASQRTTLGSADDRDPAVVQAESQLAALRATYTENHPDVQLAKRRLEEAKQFAKQNVQRLPVDAIDRQIAFNRSQIAQLQVAKSRETAQMSEVMAEKAQAPAVQQAAAQLQQRIGTLYTQFEEVSGRLLSARAGARANDEQMGERLMVVDPPVVPDTPSFPNRPLIIGIGTAAGILLGLAMALAVEFIMHPIRAPQTLTQITGVRPLALIPVITPDNDNSPGEQKPRGRFGGILDRFGRKRRAAP